MAGTNTTLNRDPIGPAEWAADGPATAPTDDHPLHLPQFDHPQCQQRPLAPPIVRHRFSLQPGRSTVMEGGAMGLGLATIMAVLLHPTRIIQCITALRSTSKIPTTILAIVLSLMVFITLQQLLTHATSVHNHFARDRYSMNPPVANASRLDYDSAAPAAPIPPRYASHQRHHHHPLDRSYEYDYNYPATDYSGPLSNAVQAPAGFGGDWPRPLASRDLAMSPMSVTDHSPVSWSRYPDHLTAHTSSSMFPLPPPPPVPVPPPPMSNSGSSSQYSLSSDRPRLPSLITSGPLDFPPNRPFPPPPALPRMEWPPSRAGSGSDRPSSDVRSPTLFGVPQSAASGLSSPGVLLPEAVSPAGAVAPAKPKANAPKVSKLTAGQRKRQRKAQPAIEDEEELEVDEDKERISKNYFQFTVATYKLMVKYLERAGEQPSSGSTASAAASASDPASPDGQRTDTSANKRSNILSDRYPTTQEIHDVDPTNALPRKRWKRLQENLQIWPNRPMFRNLSWKGCSLIIVPREHWRDLFLEHHVMRVPNPVTQAEIHRHLSARDTFHSLWKSYQTRRSRCGLTLPMIEAMVAECRCPMSANVLEEPEVGSSPDKVEKGEQAQRRPSSNIDLPLVQTRLPSPPPSANPDVLPVG
ncbi:hypothetical protein BCR44DRAFT_1459990 [Catenaria anguillulae PL171]|uniref:Uncharacterized protein n=1 Tax=Catenaria anguillulae PL171 TaxID=765915 RepID=A0A1Y2HTI8_9FUNG|nr:hypothetical protein BCR44DRAFT_1459990 [Catenaria anguillulae PL171]